MLVREESMEVSQHDTDLIQDELANLLASAHKGAAQSLRGRRSSAKLSSSQRGFVSDHPLSAKETPITRDQGFIIARLNHLKIKCSSLSTSTQEVKSQRRNQR
jgi:hypothetical protein